MTDLKLYYFKTCPYCDRVLKFIEQNELEVELKNVIGDRKAKDDLIRIGGKYQVPCLFIDGKPLYESSDIIDWLQKNQ